MPVVVEPAHVPAVLDNDVIEPVPISGPMQGQSDANSACAGTYTLDKGQTQPLIAGHDPQTEEQGKARRYM